MPEAPAPTTASRGGTSSSAHASSVPITLPPNSTPGIERGTEPVARITLPAVSARSPTSTSPSAVSVASPSITSIPPLRNSPLTPDVSVETTFSRRACTAAKSTSTASTFSPNSSASRISDRRSAERSTALAGMHA